jgi:hypothetical protein
MNHVKWLVVSLTLVPVMATSSFAQDPGWPRQRVVNGNTLVLYQPQVDDWKEFQDLHWRMALSVTPAGGKAAIGIGILRGQTVVDNDNKIVLITNIQIVETRFPGLDQGRTSQLDQLTRTFLPPAVSISLHRLLASMPRKQTSPGVQLNNDPPVIYVSYAPAILLDVDGPPLRVPVPNTGLDYVLNTRWRLFFDKATGQHLLLAGEQWMRAGSLDGPWSAAKSLPADMMKLVADAHWADVKPFVPIAPAKPDTIVPTVLYSAKPAEVILFGGRPTFAPIAGTQLVYASNTRSYVFFHAPGNRYYYLTAGRWFSAGSLNGPWTFATSDLPADFARIPPASPAAQVLASVPGTEEAKDAVLLAQVPTTVVVNAAAAAAQAKVEYTGPPQFAPIEGTSLSYATNTAQRVVQVGDVYYLCLQGLWFMSTSPLGPWQTALSVPPVIYTIPPSSPVYNVTYVTQVTTSNGNVQASYTAGYMGAFVMGMATGAVIAGGTGYYHPPYYAYPVAGYPVYHPYPATYGAVPYHNAATGAYGVSQTAYGAYGTATRTASYNPYTGTSARTASVSTAYGSAAAGQAYNPYTGAYGATRQGSSAYSQWGSSVVSRGGETAYTQHDSTAQGTVGSVQTSSGGRAAGASTAYGTTAAGKTASGDMYAGHDGNVYKNTGSGWEKYDNGSWNSAQKPTTASGGTPTRSSQATAAPSNQQRAEGAETGRFASHEGGGSEQTQRLQQEAQNRQRGEQSSQRFQQYQRSAGSAAGRFHGGGGGRRR